MWRVASEAYAYLAGHPFLTDTVLHNRKTDNDRQILYKQHTAGEISSTNQHTHTKIKFKKKTVLDNDLRDMAINGLFCADVLRPLDLAPLTDFTYKYHPVLHWFDLWPIFE